MTLEVAVAELPGGEPPGSGVPAGEAVAGEAVVAEAVDGRSAIIRAARRAFALESFAGVTLRAIAAEAGVSAALIVKHFGSKEQLFDVVTDFGSDIDSLLDAPNPELGRHLVSSLLEVRRVHRRDPILRVVFALGRADERAVLVGRFRSQVLDRLAARLAGPQAELRASLVLATLMGIGVLDTLYFDDVFPAAELAGIVDRIGPMLQAFIDG